MKRATWQFGFVAAWALLASLACASIPTEEIPEDPIAVLHWDRDAFRKREDLLQGRMPGAPLREGVASVDNLKRWLSAVSGAESLRELSRYPGHLKLLNPRNGELTPVRAAPAGARPLGWSADHKRLLYASAAGSDGYQVYEYHLDTEEVRAVTYGRETHITADYARDGRIAFGGILLDETNPEGRIYTADDATAHPRVVFDGAFAESVRWVPGSNSLIFVVREAVRGDRAGRPLLLSIDLDEEPRKPRRLGAGRSPIFTPDGEWLIYSAPVGKGWKLRRMRADASARAPIGTSIRDETQPVISPDGRLVGYLAREGDLDRLFVRRMDGSGERMIVSDGSFAYPAW